MTTEKLPNISIIIPIFNAEEYLTQCVESVLNQTMQNLEVILVNDGSTDKSNYICDKYAKQDQRVRVFHIENQGVSNARNLGISKAKGHFLMFLDSDDWIDKSTCEVTFAHALQSNLDILFWSWQKVSLKGSIKDFYLEKNSSILINNDIPKLRRRSLGLLNEELSDPTKTDAFCTPWAKLYSHNFVMQSQVRFIERKKVGMEDVLFNIELFHKAKRISYLKAYFNYYRLDNPNSLTKVDTNSLFTKFTSLFFAIEKYAISNEASQALNNRKIVSLINIVLSITNPRNRTSIYKKWKDIDTVLRELSKVVKWNEFTFSRLPLHWKLFFFLARMRTTTIFLALVYLIRLLR